jgi:hypothetical protein
MLVGAWGRLAANLTLQLPSARSIGYPATSFAVAP